MPQAAPKAQTVPVTVDNFVRAETDWAFSGVIQQGGWAKFEHFREVTPLDKQAVPRPNRDTLYSVGVFDLDAGPVTIQLPDSGPRFMTMMVVNEDHYVTDVAYGAGTHMLNRDHVGTRYVLVALRTLVDPANPKDVDEAHRLQDAVKVMQASAGKFEVPNWDEASQKKIRAALKSLGESMPDSKHAFGAKNEVDPVRHLIVTAMAWGGNPEKDAMYLNFTPPKNDGKTVHKLTLKDVPVDGFWSVTVYNAEGYLQANPQNAYSLNNITAKKDADGSVTVRFGGCDANASNCLPIMPGWNYLVRLYRPRPEVLNGEWKCPDAQPA